MHQVAIRQARLDDAGPMSLLCTQLGYASTPEQVRHRLDAILADTDHVVLAAELSASHAAELRPASLVGWIQIHVRKLVVVDRHAEVVGLVVDQAHRGQQIGSRLVQAAEEWARNHGCAAVRLRSNVQRSEAHPFYKSLGYRVIKTQLAYCRELGTPGSRDNGHD